MSSRSIFKISAAEKETLKQYAAPQQVAKFSSRRYTSSELTNSWMAKMCDVDSLAPYDLLYNINYVKLQTPRTL